MFDASQIDQINRGYVCPADAGPAWRAAAAAGVDMSLIEHSLSLSPWERLQANQRALTLVIALEEAGRQLRERSSGHS